LSKVSNIIDFDHSHAAEDAAPPQTYPALALLSWAMGILAVVQVANVNLTKREAELLARLIK
jgi:hypothetical protein